MQPRPWADTSRPSLPSVRLCMACPSRSGRLRSLTMLRRGQLVAVIALLLPGAPAFGAQAVAAEPGTKSPRLHAFRSCSNLLGYAQRHGVRVIRDSFVFQRGGAPPPAALEGGGGTERAAGGDDDSGSGETTSPTNVQEEGVDEPDRVKAANGRLY